MKIDWHTHSHYSDGRATLAELFEQAKAAGITHLGVVDHDTTAHHAEGRQLATIHGIQFIAGVEISAYDFKRKRKVHMLGYGFTGECKAIKALCAPLLSRRHEHSLWQAQQIQEAGFSLDINTALTFARVSKTLYKQHIMNALIDEPYHTKNYQTLYHSLFKGSGIATGDILYVDAFEAMRAIQEDGGVAVLAHPGQLDSFDIAEELIAEGLNGIELEHPDHTEAHRMRILKLADKHDLLLTGGSDYHGSYGAPVQLGQYTMTDSSTLLRLNECKTLLRNG